MRDIFYTVVIAWLLYRIWNAFAPKPQVKNTQQDFSQKKEGDVTVENFNSQKKSSDDKGDYIDYEEIKK